MDNVFDISSTSKEKQKLIHILTEGQMLSLGCICLALIVISRNSMGVYRRSELNPDLSSDQYNHVISPAPPKHNKVAIISLINAFHV